ncbi:chromo domain protein, partial [Rhizoctonia solani 123E]
EEYEIEKIVTWEKDKEGLWYQVRWKGYDPLEDTMERADKIAELIPVMESFIKEFPDALLPNNYKPAKHRYKKGKLRVATLATHLPSTTSHITTTECLCPASSPTLLSGHPLTMQMTGNVLTKSNQETTPGEMSSPGVTLSCGPGSMPRPLTPLPNLTTSPWGIDLSFPGRANKQSSALKGGTLDG